MLYLCMHLVWVHVWANSYKLVHYSYIQYVAISYWFKLTTFFLTFYWDPYFISQIRFILKTRRALATGRHSPGFLKLFLCKHVYVYVYVFACVCVCVCVFACVSLPPRLLITSGVMWRDIDHIRLLKQVLQLLYGNCSIIVNGRGLGVDTHHGNVSNKN